ncbi:hypothetical protein DSM21852_21270 [Methylocystis bryophila]|nr:hypothetical protein DSM21852_21270 [Methylocystis bryophila]
MHLVAFPEQKLREIGAVLSRDARDERALRHSLSYILKKGAFLAAKARKTGYSINWDIERASSWQVRNRRLTAGSLSAGRLSVGPCSA